MHIWFSTNDETVVHYNQNQNLLKGGVSSSKSRLPYPQKKGGVNNSPSHLGHKLHGFVVAQFLARGKLLNTLFQAAYFSIVIGQTHRTETVRLPRNSRCARLHPSALRFHPIRRGTHGLCRSCGKSQTS